MGVGFQAFTDSGLYQIDGDTPNFGKSLHAVCATSQGGAGSSTFFTTTTQLTFLGSTPIIAVYSPSYPVALLACSSNGSGTWTATFWSTSPTSFDVFVFDSTANCPASNSHCGLQVFNSSGVLVADSAIPFFLKPIAFLSGALSGTTAYNQTYAYGVAQAATIVGVTANVYVGQGLTIPAQELGKVQGMVSAWLHSGGTVTMAASIYTSNQVPLNNPVQQWSYPNWTGVIIDVSNF